MIQSDQETLDSCTVIFPIVTNNTSTKAGHRGFTSPRALNLGNCSDLESPVFEPLEFGDTHVP
jgi:hypothetical protein